MRLLTIYSILKDNNIYNFFQPRIQSDRNGFLKGKINGKEKEGKLIIPILNFIWNNAIPHPKDPFCSHESWNDCN